jgi:CDP-diacylglycerol--glycerol-3-phosphate 3-phosphatidyltransferase
MKLSDFFTSIRIFLAPIFFILFFLPGMIGFGAGISAFILIPFFIFMEFTDYLDGYYARKHKQVSDFGKLFDPFADVLANMTVMFAFVLSGYMPSILFLLVLYREMGMMFVRMLASRQGVAIGARKGGKAKTVLYIVAAGFSLALESASRLGISLSGYEGTARGINIALYCLAVVASLGSFVDYLVHFASLLRKATNEK